MRSLDDVRADFDAVDTVVVAMVARRQQLAKEAGDIKKAAGAAVVDPARESRNVTKRAALCAQHDVDVDVVEAVFAVLVAASRDTQR